jgi:hypothetical protein
MVLVCCWAGGIVADRVICVEQLKPYNCLQASGCCRVEAMLETFFWQIRMSICVVIVPVTEAFAKFRNSERLGMRQTRLLRSMLA